MESEEADSGCRTEAGEQMGILQSPGSGRRGQNGQWVQGGEGRAGITQRQDHPDGEEAGRGGGGERPRLSPPRPTVETRPHTTCPARVTPRLVGRYPCSLRAGSRTEKSPARSRGRHRARHGAALTRVGSGYEDQAGGGSGVAERQTTLTASGPLSETSAGRVRVSACVCSHVGALTFRSGPRSSLSRGGEGGGLTRELEERAVRIVTTRKPGARGGNDGVTANGTGAATRGDHATDGAPRRTPRPAQTACSRPARLRAHCSKLFSLLEINKRKSCVGKCRPPGLTRRSQSPITVPHRVVNGANS